MADTPSDQNLVLLNGKQFLVSPTVSNGNVMLKVENLQFTLIPQDSNGKRLDVDGQGRVKLNDSRTFKVSVTGLDANDTHELWLYSTPILLSQFTSDNAGRFADAIKISPDTDSGWHSLLLSARSTDGDAIAATLRLNIPTEQNIVIQIARSVWVWLIIPIAMASALLLPGRSSRRRRAA